MHATDSIGPVVESQDVASESVCERDESSVLSRPAVEEADNVDFVPVERIGLLGIVELILKNRPSLHRLIRDPALQPELIPRLLAVSLIGFVFFGVSMSIVLNSTGTWPRLADVKQILNDQQATLISFQSRPAAGATGVPSVWSSPWLNGSAVKLVLAYSLGLVAATGICLPCLYFYGLLSGIRMSMVDVTIHSLKSKALSAVVLVGILPIYVAISMGIVVFGAPSGLLHAILLLGLLLPFIAGFWGTRSLYVGFSGLCDTLPPERRDRRACFLRRLVFSWAACYTAIMPIMIFTLWKAMGT